ncbi:MAG: hypothetical protein J7621_03740 [Niastella sp.]|nr:hypothetical protein [Niastella sp.]
MSKPIIKSYDDLLLEKARLQAQLNVQKNELNERVRNVKEKLAPVGTILSAVGGITAMGAGNPMLKTGVGIAVDMLLKKKLFKKSGLITGLVGSFLVRNVATKVVAGTAGVLLGKLAKKLMTRKAAKPQTATQG